ERGYVGRQRIRTITRSLSTIWIASRRSARSRRWRGQSTGQNCTHGDGPRTWIFRPTGIGADGKFDGRKRSLADIASAAVLHWLLPDSRTVFRLAWSWRSTVGCRRLRAIESAQWTLAAPIQ